MVEPGDIVRTVGTESNVKEIYDACAALDRDPDNVIFNQFSEFANHLIHVSVTGPALARVFAAAAATRPGLRLAAFVSATGSAGTIGAGDYLKDHHGARIVAVEAAECPTMLYNGFGEHNIQGIGDKHIPFIHNVTNTDVACAVSDRATDELNVVFNTDVGRAALADRGVPAPVIAALAHFGLSAICNGLAAIKTARRLNLGPDDAIVTVATDGAAMYATEIDKALAKRFHGRYDQHVAEHALDLHLTFASTEHTQVLTPEIAALTPPEPEAMAAAMLDLARDAARRERLAAAAKTLAEERHTWPAFQRDFNHFFADVAAALRRTP